MRKTTGLSLLLLIFLSLCLIIFSLLSLSGATADETLIQKNADRTQEYYAAVSEANQILAEIDALLAEELLNVGYAETEDIPAYMTSASANTAENHSADSISDRYIRNSIQSLQAHFPDCVTLQENTISLTFSVPVTDSQILQVSLSADYPAAPEDTLYQITGWNVRNIDTWTPDLSQNVYVP